MAEKAGLEEIAERVARDGKDLPRSELEKLILQELVFERRTQEKIARQQLGQAAPDLAGLKVHVGELMSKLKKQGEEATGLQSRVVRQNAANREDRYLLYKIIKALRKMGTPEAESALALVPPSLIKQMRTFKENK